MDPGNKDARLKLEECKKIVRQLAFFAAIEVGDEPSAAEGLDLDSMVVEADYDGVRLGDEMTQEFIDDMTERFKMGKKIHRKYVYQIIIKVKQMVYEEPTMVEMDIPDDVLFTICGDTHGQCPSLAAQPTTLTPLQASTLISWSSFGATVPPPRNTGTCSTAILSIGAPGQRKSPSCYTPTSG